MKNDLKLDIEGLAKLIQEMFPNGEKIVEETHDENKINVNRDVINSNVGWKNHHIPKIDMRSFDGKDPITWILQMEQYFDLNNVKNTQKVRIATLHLEKNRFVWYRWLFSHKKIVTWSICIEEMIAHYEDTKRNTFLIQLINLKHKCSVGEHIEDFLKLNIRVTDISEEHMIDLFIGTLNDNIQLEVRVLEPTNHFYKEGSVATPSFAQPTRLTPQKLEEKTRKRALLQL